VVDGDGAGAGLRRVACPYLRSVDRMFLPGELQRHGLALNLSLFCRQLPGARSFAPPISRSHRCRFQCCLPIATRQTTCDFDAYATHDGYHALTIPIGDGPVRRRCPVRMIASVVQFDEIAFYRVGDFQRHQVAAPRPIAAARCTTR